MQVLTEIWAIQWEDIINRSKSLFKEFCYDLFLLSFGKLWINSTSYEYKNKSSIRSAQLIPIRIPIVCWNINPLNSTNILSNKNSSIFIISSSLYFLIDSVWFFKIRVVIPKTNLYLRLQFLSMKTLWNKLIINTRTKTLHLRQTRGSSTKDSSVTLE